MMQPNTITETELDTWTCGPSGEPRGYIESKRLTELWFHTGTICNLRCPFCLEGSKPGDRRIQALTLEDARPFLREALDLGVGQFSFTGGEPFVVRDIVSILGVALHHRPCLVLTNGTAPLAKRMDDVRALRTLPNPLRFRISLDYADETLHDRGRGPGNFRRAVSMLQTLNREGFPVSVARQRATDEDVAAVDRDFRQMLAAYGLPKDIPLVSFPDFLQPNARGRSPVITEDCMTTYHTEESRALFMCSYSRMVVKKNGRCGVYACTLVDDDPDYDLGGTLAESMGARVMMKHHRCYSCFACGASCSDPGSTVLN